MLNYKSYGDLSRDVSGNLQKIPPIDFVVGIPKSGLVPAIMIAALRNVRFYDLDTFQFAFSARRGVRRYSKQDEYRPRVLVVDDSVNTGAELEKTRAKLSSLSEEFEFVFCAVYGRDFAAHQDVADMVLSCVKPPRIFQWNYRNHIIAEHSLFDMDGVLCVDPTDDENDDGEAYLRFLSAAKPLTIPTKNISAIVTSRLEKYRLETEEWLERNGVQYRELFMIDLPSAEARRRLRAHGAFKSKIYKSRHELLFVESNWKQAQFIAREADKPVICTENDFLIFGREHWNYLNKTKQLDSEETGAIEAILQQRVERLTNRLIQTDPYAAHWLKETGIDADLRKVSEISPFLKGRIVTSALVDGEQQSGIRERKRRRKGEPLRVLMVCATFDVERGAGAAASSKRLRDALAAEGVDVHSLSLDDFPNRGPTHVDQPVAGSKVGFWNSYSDGSHWRAVEEKVREVEPDCIVLGAVDRGILSMFDIARFRYPIVWISRDNWVHTGGCLFKLPIEEIKTDLATDDSFFQALACDGYKSGCQQCPALRDVRESAKARINFEFKRIVLNYRKDIVFAPISDWMAKMLKQAPLTQNHSVLPVVNPIDLKLVRKLARRPKRLRNRFGLSRRDKIVFLAAHSLENPRKGLRHFLDALPPEDLFSDVVFVCMGDKGSKGLPFPPHVRNHVLGFVEDEDEKVEIYNEVDVTLVPSFQESLSVVASDSICCGTPVVAYRTSGLSSFLRHRETGYLAEPFDAEDLVRGLLWVLYEADNEYLSLECIRRAEQCFESSRNSRLLIDVIDQAIEKHRALGELPIEIETLASAMELMHEDLRFRYDHERYLSRKARRAKSANEVNPYKLLEQLDEMRGKLTWNRRRREELEKIISDFSEKEKGAGVATKIFRALGINIRGQ